METTETTESVSYSNLPDNIEKSKLSPTIKKILNSMLYYSSQNQFGEFSFSTSYISKFYDIDVSEVSYGIRDIINLGFAAKTFQGNVDSGCSKYILNYDVINSYQDPIPDTSEEIYKILEVVQMNLELTKKLIDILEKKPRKKSKI